ncbi:uncharacterized protein LOC110266751 [Arachis ipaensis]|uniref:uncharacterized protein LOC110266751 n=1 Tax=Arachis ipaensis TaxID=130454 RepID=UPI000A2B0648|nr:uncharacterized protein LOC110266751 [Arachis ipaensis]
MTYDDLRENLLAFENTYLKKDTKKKGVALKSVTESLKDESSDDSSNYDFVLFAKKFRRMMKQKERNKGGSLRKLKRDLSKVICHNYREAGHYKFDCPNLKKEDKPKREKKKGLMTSWEDLENESEDEEELGSKSQICLMANQTYEVRLIEPTTEDFHLMIDHLNEKIICFLNENYELESQVTILKSENDFLKVKLREAETAVDFVEKNKQLKAEIKGCEYHHSVIANLNFFEKNERLYKEDYPHEFIIGDPSQGITTRSSRKKQANASNIAFLSQMEPLNMKQALEDPSWVKAMEEELSQFEKNEVWTLVPNSNGKKVTGTKWIFKNKLGEDGSVVRNKARLVA